MFPTYQGYFRDGRFISPEIDSIPDGVMVFVTVVGEAPSLPELREMVRGNELTSEKIFEYHRDDKDIEDPK